jgi:hypothetical protein
MQRSFFKAVLVCIGAAVVFFLLLGVLIAPKAHAESPCFRVTNPVEVFPPHFMSFWRDFEDDSWEDEDWDQDRTNPEVRYNRVEGLYLGMKMDRDYLKLEYPNQSYLFGSCGYAFAAKEFEYQLGLEKGMMEEYRLAIGGEYHRLIDTPDYWIIGSLENSLAAFLLREDFQDFYLREGGSAYLEQHFTRHAQIQVGYQVDRLDDMSRHTKWSLFGGKKKFRPNPAMSTGDLAAIQASLVLDTRNSKNHPSQGWWIQIDGEHALADGHSDFKFDRFVADIRRYQPLGYGEGIDIRLRAGSATGAPPWQRTFHLGGLSTLRGFRYKAFPMGPMEPGGNRMLLGQAELRIGSEIFQESMDLDMMSFSRFVLFADAGWVGDADTEGSLFEGFDGLGWSDFKSDVGIAFTNNDGNVRFEIARRTDTSEKPFTFLMRLKRDF